MNTPIAKILPIARMGNPILQRVAEPVNLQTELEYAKGVVSGMIATLESLGERVGLAAPQVHISKRIVIFRLPKGKLNPRYAVDIDEEIPLTSLLNPTITPIGNEMFMGWEPCISVPGLMGQVPRFRHIHYSYYDLAGCFHESEAHDFLARLLQHECDHLDGILFPHRMTDWSTLGFEEEILKAQSVNPAQR